MPSTVSNIEIATRPITSTSSVLSERCTSTLSMTTWKNSGETSANSCRKNDASSTSPSRCRYLWIAPRNQVMSKRRPMSDNPARRVIRIRSAVPDREQVRRATSGGTGILRRLHQHFVFAGLGDHHEAAVAQAWRSPATAFWQAATSWCGTLAPSIQSPWRTGESPMRQSCLFRADGGSARDPPRHPGNAATSRGPRVPKIYAVAVGLPCSSAFSRVSRASLRSRVLRHRQQRRLAGLRISHRRRAMALTRRDEGRCHELPEQGGSA